MNASDYLANGIFTIPPGKIAGVVTYYEMRAPAPAPRRAEAEADWTFEHVPRPTSEFYRDLYRRVGAEQLWYGRLTMAPEDLERTLAHPDVMLNVLSVGGSAEGIAELDFRTEGEAELVYFGVTAKLMGTRAARFMMNRAIALAFSRGVSRLWLHTDSNDDAKATAFYERSGFRAFARAVEVADDPRVTGLYPRETAPRIAIIEA